MNNMIVIDDAIFLIENCTRLPNSLYIKLVPENDTIERIDAFRNQIIPHIAIVWHDNIQYELIDTCLDKLEINISKDKVFIGLFIDYKEEQG